MTLARAELCPIWPSRVRFWDQMAARVDSSIIILADNRCHKAPLLPLERMDIYIRIGESLDKKPAILARSPGREG